MSGFPAAAGSGISLRGVEIWQLTKKKQNSC